MEVINVERLLCEKDEWVGRTVSVTGWLVATGDGNFITPPARTEIEMGVLIDFPHFRDFARGPLLLGGPLYNTPCQITGTIANTPLAHQGMAIRDLTRGGILYDVRGRPRLLEVDFDDEYRLQEIRRCAAELAAIP